MRIVITGAAGEIGGVVVEELRHSHELVLIDIRPVGTYLTIIADLSKLSAFPQIGDQSNWSEAFKGADVVVHLAANKHVMSSWSEVMSDNIQATWNVFEAAARHRIPRVVYASSNWAVKSLERQLAPACYQPQGPKIDSVAFPCPVNAYGLSKAFGEIAGRMYVDENKLQTVIAIRIGHFNPTPSDDKELRTRWIGVKDMMRLIRCCVEAECSGFHVVYGVSAQATAPYDLTHTTSLLSWTPEQIAPEISV